MSYFLWEAWMLIPFLLTCHLKRILTFANTYIYMIMASVMKGLNFFYQRIIFYRTILITTAHWAHWSINPSQKHPPLFCQVPPSFHLQTVQAPLYFRQFPLFIGFSWTPPKNQIFQWTPLILNLWSLTPSFKSNQILSYEREKHC